MTNRESGIVEELASKALELSNFSDKELDRFCWMVVHNLKHGVMPSEYDIREIDEDLYLSVLQEARKRIE